MAQHDYDIANASGATVRADINSVLDAIATNNSGSSAPSTMFANMLWYDTNLSILMIRNEANSAWLRPLVGKHTIYFNDGSGTAQTTNGPAFIVSEQAADNYMIVGWAFDASTSETLQVSTMMPKGYAGGTITAKAFWAHTTTTTNFGVSWEISGVSIGNDESLNATFGSVVNIDDTGGSTSGYKQYISPVSSAITVTGAAAEERFTFSIARDVADGADTLAVDAVLLGIEFFYIVDSPTDD